MNRLLFMLFRRPRLARRGVIVERWAVCDAATECEGQNRLVAGARLVRSRLGLGSYVAENGFLSDTVVGRFSSIGPRVATVKVQVHRARLRLAQIRTQGVSA